MAALAVGIHVLTMVRDSKTWMHQSLRVTRAGMTIDPHEDSTWSELTHCSFVPAKAGTQGHIFWIPASAGMSGSKDHFNPDTLLCRGGGEVSHCSHGRLVPDITS